MARAAPEREEERLEAVAAIQTPKAAGPQLRAPITQTGQLFGQVKPGPYSL
jgi:hypothetical protein